MSNTNVNREFVIFGKRIKVIAILTLLSLILGIVGAFIPLVGIIALIFSLIIIIYFLLVLGNVKRAGKELNSKELLAFTPRFIIGTIVRFIGQALMSVGSLYINQLTVIIGLIVIGVVLIIIGSVLRYKAWGGLQTFFITNFQLFPPQISDNGISGAKLCKIATILDMTIFLSFIGEILRIIGYFKLAATQNLVGAPTQPIYQPTTPQPISTKTPSAPSINFCPNCGSSVSSGAKYCPACGSQIT
jgi:hypothetical protein